MYFLEGAYPDNYNKAVLRLGTDAIDMLKWWCIAEVVALLWTQWGFT